MREIVIPKEQAVFWMDEQGRWCNAHGIFQHKKIIDYFNACIRKDDKGYFVEQIRDGIREKVYFGYVDTPLFIVDLSLDSMTLELNTGKTIQLDPGLLYVHKDSLYIRMKEEAVKFSERALLKLSELIGLQEGRYYFQLAGRKYRIPEE